MPKSSRCCNCDCHSVYSSSSSRSSSSLDEWSDDCFQKCRHHNKRLKKIEENPKQKQKPKPKSTPECEETKKEECEDTKKTECKKKEGCGNYIFITIHG